MQLQDSSYRSLFTLSGLRQLIKDAINFLYNIDSDIIIIVIIIQNCARVFLYVELLL